MARTTLDPTFLRNALMAAQQHYEQDAEDARKFGGHDDVARHFEAQATEAYWIRKALEFTNVEIVLTYDDD